MEIKTLGRKLPEQVFGVFKNGESSLINGGTPVCVDYTTTADGISVILPTTAMLRAFAGCVKDGTVMGTSGQPDEYGLVQIYGHHPGVLVSGTTVVPGDPLVPSNAKTYVERAIIHSNSAVESPNEVIAFVTAGTTFGGTTAVVSCPAFIRAM